MMMVEENWKILLLGGRRRIVEDIYLMHFILFVNFVPVFDARR